MRHAYTNATIWTAAGDPIESGTLLVEDGKVVDVGPDVDVSGTDVTDCSGTYIIPGLIDAHVHTGVAGEGASNDWDTNETTEAITPYVRTLDAIYPEDVGFDDARRGGVTTLGVMHGSANPIGGQLTVVKSRGTIVEDMVLRFPGGVKMALGENPKRVGQDLKRAPGTRMGSAYLARKAFLEAIEYRNRLGALRGQGRRPGAQGRGLSGLRSGSTEARSRQGSAPQGARRRDPRSGTTLIASTTFARRSDCPRSSATDS